MSSGDMRAEVHLKLPLRRMDALLALHCFLSNMEHGTTSRADVKQHDTL